MLVTIIWIIFLIKISQCRKGYMSLVCGFPQAYDQVLQLTLFIVRADSS